MAGEKGSGAVIGGNKHKGTVTVVSDEPTPTDLHEKSSMVVVNKDTRPQATFTLVNKDGSPTKESLTAIDDEKFTLLKSSTAFGYLPYITPQHNKAARANIGNQLSPSGILENMRSALAKMKYYRSKEQDSTIWQFSLKTPDEFASYRKEAITVFQELNQLQDLAQLSDDDILNNANKEHFQEYIKIYKKLYPRPFEEIGLKGFDTATFDYNALNSDQRELLKDIIQNVKPHLAYAKMYDKAEITVVPGSTVFKHDGTTLLTIQNKTNYRGGHDVSYVIADNLNEEQMKLALAYMAEEMSQRRIFASAGRRLNPRSHPAQLLILAYELICVRRIHIENLAEIKAAIAEQFNDNSDMKNLLNRLTLVNSLTYESVSKEVEEKAVGIAAARAREVNARNIGPEIEQLFNKYKIKLTNTSNQPNPTSHTSPTGPVGAHTSTTKPGPTNP
jgi:hypothetical protein